MRITTFTAQKMKFSIEETADLVTFTEEILNGKLHFLCSVLSCCVENVRFFICDSDAPIKCKFPVAISRVKKISPNQPQALDS